MHASAGVNLAIALLLAASHAEGGASVEIDLSDSWAPRIFTETAERPQPYRHVYVTLANERPGDGPDWDRARRDRYYELFGIFPTPAVVRARLLDQRRHACHAAVDPTPLRSLAGTLTPRNLAPPGTAQATLEAAALRALQAHLRCEGFLPANAVEGTFDRPTRAGLAYYHRRHMLPSAGLDTETRIALTTDSRELDFRMLLRVLRERVTDAAGLIEDGSARNGWAPILGRYIDAAEYRAVMREAPLPSGAEDLIARATESAARALGWTSPEAAREALAGGVPSRVRVVLPPLPAYHTGNLELRAEIDRGDVWASRNPEQARSLPGRRRPTLVLYAVTSSGDLPLLRWPTTIGGWQPERQPDGTIATVYKASPVGRRYWRDLLASPAWYPPSVTPDRELVRRRPDGSWVANEDIVGPGYRSAYGLVALLHHRALEPGNPSGRMKDTKIRTHGSVGYRSILRGHSHGCHRLFNHLAVRLGSFLLAHRPHVAVGEQDGGYTRRIRWQGQTLVVHADSRGYLFRLDPPVPVDVLPGRRVKPGPPAPPGGPVAMLWDDCQSGR